MNDNPDEDPTLDPKPAVRTLKLKGPRIERPPPPAPGRLPMASEERPNFLSRVDHIKRQMQADMDALADPAAHGKKRV